MKMEILLEPTSNKLMVGDLCDSIRIKLVTTGKKRWCDSIRIKLVPEHAEFDESDTYVLERFDTSAGNLVKEILLKLNLPNHRLLKDGGEVLGRERFTGPNYMDWMRNLRFTLRYENKEYVLDEQIPTINNDSTQEEIEAHQKHYDDANKVSCIMASSMSCELQKTFENTWDYEMNQQLKEMFQAKASKERLDVVKSLMACKPKPEASICTFVLEMKGKRLLRTLGIMK
ncbi:hypothetical protein Tco_1538728 [Tanacetum coccineum]